MINSLDVALKLNARYKVREFFVSQKVFMDVLKGPQPESSGDDSVVLNRPYDSPNFRFLNKAQWKGIMIIYLSNERLSGVFDFAAVGT